MPRESFPEIKETKIYISSVYPGNTAEDIEKLIKQNLPQEVIAGFEPDPNAVAQPIQLRSQQHQQSRKPRPGNAGGGNGGGKPAAKRGSPPKRSFNR